MFTQNSVYLNPESGLVVLESEVEISDTFNPRIPTDRLCSINWCTEGSIAVYAKDMTPINTYGVGERMLVPNPDHLRLGRCLLICVSETAKYYCLHNSHSQAIYYNGDVIQLSANEERTFTDNNGHFIFCSLGSLTNLDKFAITTIDSDSYVVTAGAEGAIITVFHDSTDD
tara:strand:- start:166 stop:678 length:513 start_codon:yes stop_codon:yes gene_type:complete